MKQESLYKLSPASAAIFNEFHPVVDASVCSAELIRRWYSSMDNQTKALADRTLRCLESIKPLFWDRVK